MKVLIGFTGSVATILAEKLVAAVMEKGHDVSVILTESGNKILPQGQRWKIDDMCDGVYMDVDEWQWEEPGPVEPRKQWLKDDPVLHIELRKWADAMIIAPLSANTLGKIANGMCDNLLTCVVRAWDWSKPCIVAPAMNTFMWESPITGRNLEQVKIYGSNFIIVPPISKELACGDEGMGAMARIETIVDCLPDL